MLAEFILSLRSHDLWLYMGMKDVQLRFRRSRLGPGWVIINTLFFIVFMSLLWSTIFKMDIKDYMLYFAAGHVIWTYISGVVNESGAAFVEFEHIVKQVRLPYYVFPLRIIVRNTLIFLMNMSIVFCMAFWAGGISVAAIGWFFLALIFLISSLAGVSFLISIAACRFKDLTQIVPNFLLIAFFCTPIMWKKDLLSIDKQWIADFNPLSLVFDSLRIPLMGGVVSPGEWGSIFLLSLTTLLLGIFVFNGNIHKITKWL